MKGMTVYNAAAACNGRFIGPEALLDRTISFVTTDSRQAGPDCLFIAIKGDNSDGHDYMVSAVQQGALCSIAEREPYYRGAPCIIVESTLAAIRDLAAYYRSQFSIPFIGITGSVGKTTFKDIISCVLGARFKVHKTQGNFNNEIGVPLTIFGLKEDHEVAVVEMGISAFGEMSRLGAIVRPDIAVFSTIGYSHLEFLGSREGVLKAKSEILEYMPQDGTVFVNGDDEMLKTVRCTQKIISFGIVDDCDVKAENIRHSGLDGTNCDIVAKGRRIPVKISAYGLHMVTAALAAAAVGIELGLDDAEIIRGIGSYASADRRASIKRAGRCTIIDDSYNANPTSVESSLKSLKQINTRRVCILGDMLELGPDSAALHRRVGRIAAQAGIDVILCCGEKARDIYQGALDCGTDQTVVYFDDKDDLEGALDGIIKSGDTVLVKASRGMHFEDIVKALASALK